MFALRHFDGHARVAADAELHHEALDDAEEAGVVEEPELHEVVEAVGPVGRPVAVNLDDEGAVRRGEARAEDVGRLRGGEGGVELRRVVVDGLAPRCPPPEHSTRLRPVRSRARARLTRRRA